MSRSKSPALKVDKPKPNKPGSNYILYLILSIYIIVICCIPTIYLLPKIYSALLVVVISFFIICTTSKDIFTNYKVITESPTFSCFQLSNSGPGNTVLVMIQSAITKIQADEILKEIKVFINEGNRVEIYMAPLKSSNHRGSKVIENGTVIEDGYQYFIDEVFILSKKTDYLYTYETDNRKQRGCSFIKSSDENSYVIPTQRHIDSEEKFHRFGKYPSPDEIKAQLNKWNKEDSDLKDYKVSIDFGTFHQSYMADVRAWFLAMYHPGEGNSDGIHSIIDEQLIEFMKTGKTPNNARTDVKVAIVSSDPRYNDVDDLYGFKLVCSKVYDHISHRIKEDFYECRD